MRVAVTQVELRGGQRSRNLATVIAVIVKAAQQVPAPDLIVLPASCDLGPGAGGGADRLDHLSQAMCEGFVETLGALAREWGVWIAAGHNWVMDGKRVASATLLDADGDARIRVGVRTPVSVTPQSPDSSRARAPALPTGLGLLALQLGLDGVEGSYKERTDLIIVPVSPGAPISAAADLARAAGSHVCVACAVDGSPGKGKGAPASSRIVDRNGKTLAVAKAGQPEIIMVDLMIDPVSAAPMAVNTPTEIMKDAENLE